MSKKILTKTIVVLLLFNIGYVSADSDNSVTILVTNGYEGISGQYEIVLSDNSIIEGKTDDGWVKIDSIHQGIFTFTFSGNIGFNGIPLTDDDFSKFSHDEIDVVNIDLDEHIDWKSINWNLADVKILFSVDLFTGGSYVLFVYQGRGIMDILE
jgi:hypothetical protein